MMAICGPTASGKSELGIKYAQELSGEVINIDSVQIYKDFWIGSAKVKEDERCGVIHHLVDLLDPNDRCDAARFAAMVWSAAEDVSKRGKLPILVGGGGMHFTSIVHGLAALPSGADDIRKELEKCSIEELREMLEEEDPIAFDKINDGDRVRTIRALEASRLGSDPISMVQANHRFSEVKLPGMVVVICLPRDELYRRINARTEKMLADGLLEESEQLLKKYGKDAHPFGSLGYRQALACLEGKLAKEKLAEEIATKTRQFAKRQVTYWRNEPEKRGWKQVEHPLGVNYRVYNIGIK